MPIRKAQWKTDTQFNYGTPIKTNVEVVGSGDAAYIALTARPDNSENINFTTPADYTYDISKIVVGGGKATLYPTGGVNDWNFIIPTDYTYTPTDISVAGGVAKLYGSSIVPYAWWHFNETSGTNVADSSGNGRNGTTSGSPSWVSGKLNNGLQLNGSTQYVDFGAVASFERTQAYSHEFWIKSSTTPGVYGAIISKYDAAAVRGFMSYIDNLPTLVCLVATSGTNYLLVRTSATAILNGLWHYVVVTYDGSSSSLGVKIYFDGVLQANSVIKDNLNATIINAQNLRIGRDSGGNYFTGVVDEVAIHDKVLSLAEITFRYNSGTGIEDMPGSYLAVNPPIYPNTGFVFSSAIGSFTETATKPSGSAIKYHVSVDDGATWKWWTGAVWATTDNTYTQSNTASDIHTNIASLASSGIFRFRALLHSDAGIVTPQLDNIQIITGIVYPTGNNEIMYDNDIDPTYITAWLTFVETVTKPANTNILYQYSEDSGGTWNGSWLTAAQTQTAIQGIASPDKLKIKIQLSTTDSSVTPEIDNILITSNAGYYTNGSYESIAYQPENNTNGVYLQDITITKTVPGGTSLMVEVRHVNHALEVGYVTYNDGDSIELCGDIIQWKATFVGVGAVSPQLDLIEISFHTLIGIMQTIDNNMDIVRKIETGRWKIDATAKTMTFYDDDGVTPLYVYNLKDQSGNPTYTNPFERVLVP